MLPEGAQVWPSRAIVFFKQESRAIVWMLEKKTREPESGGKTLHAHSMSFNPREYFLWTFENVKG